MKTTLQATHDQLSELLEEPGSSAEAIRRSAVAICLALNAEYEFNDRMHSLLADHSVAWANEEDSVKEEHVELIQKTEELLTECRTRGASGKPYDPDEEGCGS